MAVICDTVLSSTPHLGENLGTLQAELRKARLMAINDFLEALGAALKASDEDHLIDESCYYPEGLEPNDLELLQTMSALFFADLYGRCIHYLQTV